jgi:hypothetical protein
LVAPGDRATARAPAALQARRRELFRRAQNLEGEGDALIDNLPLEDQAMDRAEAALTALANAKKPTAAVASESHAGT